jgi:hypothetical protein
VQAIILTKAIHVFVNAWIKPLEGNTDGKIEINKLGASPHGIQCKMFFAFRAKPRGIKTSGGI